MQNTQETGSRHERKQGDVNIISSNLIRLHRSRSRPIKMMRRLWRRICTKKSTPCHTSWRWTSFGEFGDAKQGVSW